MIFAPIAHAFPPPTYDAEVAVFTVPADLAFPTRQVAAAARATTHPVVVVIAAEVADGRIEPGHESETEDAIEAVWQAWTVDPRFDAAHTSVALLALDEREVRLRAGTAWDATYGFGPAAVGDVIDAAFLPLAAVGDLDGGLAAMVTELDARVVGAEQRARTLRAAGLGLVGLAGVGGPLAGLGALAVATARARRAFTEALAARRALVANAGARLDDLGLSYELRDRIVALRLKGERTVALCAEVLTALDRLRVGVAALGARLDAVERDAGGALPAAWHRARAALDAPFPYDTGAIASGLFDPPTQAVTVDPAVFAATLEADWARASAGWDRILDAVDASLRTARADLVADDLDELRQVLAANELPQAWVGRHPLATDPDAAWALLDELRVADPVAYLEALERALSVDDALEAEVAELLGLREAVRAARGAVPDLTGVRYAPSDPDDDPGPLRDEAERTEAAFVGTMARAERIEAARAAAGSAIDAARRLGELSTRIALAARTGEEALARVGAELDGLGPEVDAVRRELDALVPHHAAEFESKGAPPPGPPEFESKGAPRPGPPELLDLARRELGEALTDAAQGRRALHDARAAWEARHVLRAVRLAEAALDERRQTLENLRQTRQVLAAAEDAREDAERLWETVATTRATYADRLGQLAGASAALAEGDRVLAELRSTWDTPGDWLVRRTALRSVIHAWASATDALVSAARARREREARVAAAAAPVGSWSVSRSRSSGSAYRSASFSSGSSRRSSSSGRTSGASSRSAGRSVGRSSGRSAGRKF